jgi:hypothetical protein
MAITIFGKVRVATTWYVVTLGGVKEGYLGNGLWDYFPNRELTHHGKVVG